MKVINESTVVVFSNSELKDVLENNNGYNYIYLGADIIIETGIKISSFKVNSTIDGTYENVRHTFTDKKSLSSSDTISVSSATILKVTVCNMNIVGYNYYGTIYVPENTAYKNIVIEYNNITYNGPQISFNPVGLTRFVDCDINIVDSTTTVGNEVAECNKIEIGGNTSIIHRSKSNSAFWFRNSEPSFAILTNSNVTFLSEYRELFYGPTDLTFSIFSNSVFSLTSHSGMAYGNHGTGITNIYPNSEFILKQTECNGNYSTWYSYGTITVGDNSSLLIINDYSGITSSNYNILFSSKGGLVLNNPKEIVLYNNSANIISSSSSIPFDFKFSRINLFNKTIDASSDISLENMPNYSWYKDSKSSSISGKFTSTTTTIENHNYTEEELKELSSLSDFVFANKKIFSLGDLAFRVNSLTDSDIVMSGKTGSLNSILISYDNTNAVVKADDNGTFSYSYDTPLEIGTKITFNVKKNNGFIYHTKVIEIVYSGELILDSATKIINFDLEPISTNPIICPKSINLVVNVIDTRVNSTEWKLYASVNYELLTTSNETFSGAIVYKSSDGNIVTLSDKPTLVYTGTGETNTSVNFNTDEGILLMINEKIVVGKEYTSNIIWSIQE